MRWSISSHFTLSFILLLCYVPLPHSSHAAVQCDEEAELCGATTTVDQSDDVRDHLWQQWVNLTLDKITLVAFPVLRGERIEEVNIAEEIWANHSVKFGRRLLGFEEHRVDEIVRNNPETANIQIISQWLNGKGVTPITCRTLASVLHNISFDELANEIEDTCEILMIIDDKYMPMKVKEYSQWLSDKYNEDAVIDSTWLPKRLHGRKMLFVDLKLKEKGRDTSQHYLFGDLQSGTRILLLGKPGVGKTTFTHHLAKTLVERFYLIIEVHIGVAGKIDGLADLLSGYLDPDNIVSDYINGTHGEGVCFLLDDFHEHNGSSYIAKLVQGKVLSKSVVVATSRLGSATDIKNFFHRVVEITGFREKSIEMFLRQLNLSGAEYQSIHQHIRSHPNVMQFSSLPLHLSMLVYIAVLGPDDLSLVHTETKLYSNFLSLIIKQYESVSLMECFDGVQRGDDLCVLFRNISKVSFEGILKRTLNSSLDEHPDSVSVSAEIKGLLKGKVKNAYVCHYSHPIFQEFLAALHLTTLPREEQLLHCRMHGAYKFFLGLIGSELDGHSIEIIAQTLFNYATSIEPIFTHKQMHIMKYAYEVGRPSQFAFLLRESGIITNSNSMHVYTDFSTNQDCWCVGYTLMHSVLYEVVLESGSELARCVSPITEYMKHSHESVNVTKLILRGSYFFMGEEVLDVLPVFQNDLTHLELAFMRFEHDSSVSYLGEILKPFKKLNSLALSVSIDVIKEGLIGNTLGDLAHLEHLELGIIDDAAVPDDLLLELKDLKRLKSMALLIGWNKEYVNVNATALIGGLRCLTELQSLYLFLNLYGGFRDNGVDELLNGLNFFITIPDLELDLDLCSKNGMGNATTEELAMALTKLTMLKNLSLCVDFISSGEPGLGHSGVRKLSEGLLGLTGLHKLRLSLYWEVRANESIDEAAMALVDGLKHLHSLRVFEFYFKHNGSCSEMSVLFKFLTHLQELKLICNNPGGDANATKLIGGLKHLKHLRKLHLAWNALKDGEIEVLVQALGYMKHLQTLDLSHNEIGDTGLQLLAEVIESQHLSHLQVLLLNDNKFTRTGAEVFSQKVVKLLELHTLCFGGELGNYSTLALHEIFQSALSRKRLSDAPFNRTSTLMGGFVIGVTIVVGGLLCYFAFNLTPVLPGS
jgi:Ran GTPase-activating protein (RanGAP) involved in mRNA processing and transport/DNA polymerase III delta prime subunit